MCHVTEDILSIDTSDTVPLMCHVTEDILCHVDDSCSVYKITVKHNKLKSTAKYN